MVLMRESVRPSFTNVNCDMKTDMKTGDSVRDL